MFLLHMCVYVCMHMCVRTSASLCMQNVCVCHQPCCPNGTLCSLTFLITLHKSDLMNTHGDREKEGESTGGELLHPVRLIDQKTEKRVLKDHITV